MRRIAATAASIGIDLSSTTGVLAQQQSDTETIAVDLVAAPVCAVDLEFASGSFGAWERSGTIWVDATPQDGAVLFLTATISAQAQNGFDVIVAFDGLNGPGGSIPANDEYFSAADDIGGTLHSENPASWTHTGVLAPEFTVGYGLQTSLTASRRQGDTKAMSGLTWLTRPEMSTSRSANARRVPGDLRSVRD